AVGAAARTSLALSRAALATAAARGLDVSTLSGHIAERAAMADGFVDAYRRYCWPVESLSDLAVAPFHLLASEGGVHVDRDHVWHMETLAVLAAVDVEGGPRMVATPYRVIDVTDPTSEAEGVAWWEALTAAGGEGMVVKPLEFVARG